MIEEFIPARTIQLRTSKGVSARDMSLSIAQAARYINNIENKKTLPSIEGLSTSVITLRYLLAYAG